MLGNRQVLQIRALAGKDPAWIARKFSIRISLVKSIIEGRAYSHVNDTMFFKVKEHAHDTIPSNPSFRTVNVTPRTSLPNDVTLKSKDDSIKLVTCDESVDVQPSIQVDERPRVKKRKYTWRKDSVFMQRAAARLESIKKSDNYPIQYGPRFMEARNI